MAFTSWAFVALAAAMVALYYLVPRRAQWPLLLAAAQTPQYILRRTFHRIFLRR